jgi:hypothetical protein
MDNSDSITFSLISLQHPKHKWRVHEASTNTYDMVLASREKTTVAVVTKFHAPRSQKSCTTLQHNSAAQASEDSSVLAA